MSSLVRRIQLRKLRAAKKVSQRHKAINRFKGFPYRNCIITKRNEFGEVMKWKRYH